MNSRNHKSSLPVMEEFYTIQGEGYYSGRPAYFIRLGGCDVGCSWCDVKESWDFEAHPHVDVDKLVNNVLLHNSNFVVITGGEPTLYNLDEITKKLALNGIETAIETSGTNELSGSWHWVCFSPKKFKKPVESIYHQANELKVIVVNKHDLLWAQEHEVLVNKSCKLFVQPEWDKKEKMFPEIIDFVKSNPQWQLSIQSHKYINVP